MKKYLAILIALVLVSSLVLAANGNGNANAGNSEVEATTTETDAETEEKSVIATQETSEEETETEDETTEEKPEKVREKEQKKVHLTVEEKKQFREKVIGLENALTNVKNENARLRLEQNLEKFQAKVQERLQRMENVEVEEVNEETGVMKVKAHEEVKFLGFIKGKATKRFEIDNNGNITEKHPWYKFLYAEVEPVESQE